MTPEQRIEEWVAKTLADLSMAFDRALFLESAARTFAAAAREEAIEECAKVCDSFDDSGEGPHAEATKAIRALKEHKI